MATLQDPETPARPPSEGGPPLYSEQRDDPDEILQPTIFILNDRFVHAETANSTPLYELSRQIHAQGAATTIIEFERLSYRVRTSADGTPSAITKRSKQLYNLTHLQPWLVLDFLGKLHPTTRKGLGEVGIRKSSFPHTGHRAVPIVPDRNGSSSGGSGRSSAAPAHLFTIKEKRHGLIEWINVDGNVVATQDSKSDGGQHKLLVAVPLPRRTLDGLVALWCLWLWHLHSVNTREKLTWKEVKQILQKPHGFKGGFL